MDPETFRCLAIAKALRLYHQHKIKVNRAYTPGAMLNAASGITGKTYKRGAYLAAAADLEALYQSRRPI